MHAYGTLHRYQNDILEEILEDSSQFRKCAFDVIQRRNPSEEALRVIHRETSF